MSAPGLSTGERLERYRSAFEGIDAPFAFVDLDAMWSNSDAMLARAKPKPIRVASKSLRCRSLLEAVLAREGYQGLMCFTLPEALWLAEQGHRDLLVAYPTADRAGLRRLGEFSVGDPEGAPVVMVDCREHLDLIAACAPGAPVRVCLDLDASWWLAGGRVRIGPKRTPVHEIAQAVALAGEILARAPLRLAGMMCYEGHIAGVGDDPPHEPARRVLLQTMQRRSYAELRERRAQAVEAVRAIAPLAFVNAGGTGDLERVAGEPAVTEATAGSGFYAPTLFDRYSAFELEPAAMFALPVTRRPAKGIVTALGGGYPASGAAGADRSPSPYLPPGLRLDSQEGAGEVQTPLLGAAADRLAIGDRVYMRHAKAGELCERFDRLYLVRGAEIVDQVPTYRGEGKTFL